MRLARRLAALEKFALTLPRMGPAEWRARLEAEYEEKWQAAWAIMRSTMKEEHARLVLELRQIEAEEGNQAIWNLPGENLYLRCSDAIYGAVWRRREWPYTEVPSEVILAMPPRVAEVYLTDRDAVPIHDCEDCGYRVPIRRFPQCPLCGGKTGYYAFWRKRAEDKPALA